MAKLKKKSYRSPPKLDKTINNIAQEMVR